MVEFIDEKYKSKIPLLVASLILFALTLYFYSSLEITLLKLSNISEVFKLLETIYAPNFLLFIALLALTVTTTTYSTFKIEKKQATLNSVLFILITVIFSALTPTHVFAFLLIAITLAVIPILASEQDTNYDNASKTTSKAFTVLAILAFVGTVIAVQTNTQTYQDNFLMGVNQVVPQVASSVIPICAQAIEKINPTQAIDKNQIAAVTATTYAAYRNSLLASAPQLSNQLPTFENLPGDTRNNLIDTNYNAAVNAAKQSLASISNQLKTQTNNTKVPTLQESRAQLQEIPQFELISKYLPIAIALMVILLLGVVMFFVKILTAAFNFTLSIITTNTKETTRGKH